jgi:hypothetical protein
MFDIAEAAERHLVFRCSGWLTPPRLSAAVAWSARILPGAPARFTHVHERILERAALELNLLQPVAKIRERVAEFSRRQFRPRMIGVHVRRGDYPAQRPDATPDLNRMVRGVRQFLCQMPDAGVFLATDDGAPNPYTAQPTRAEGVLQRFRDEFGARVVATQPAALDRHCPEAIEAALVDLLLLRETHAVVGSEASSFSELAVFGRKVPHLFCAGRNRLKWVWRLTLIEPAVVLVGVWQLRRLAPFPVLMAHYREQVRKRLRAAS